MGQEVLHAAKPHHDQSRTLKSGPNLLIFPLEREQVNIRQLAIVLIGTTAIAFGQAPHPAAKPDSPKAPAISDTLKLKFFKAESETQGAADQAKQTAQNAQQKQAGFQAVVKELQDACGKDFIPTMDGNGDPVCVVKPAAKEAEKPTETKK